MAGWLSFLGWLWLAEAKANVLDMLWLWLAGYGWLWLAGWLGGWLGGYIHIHIHTDTYTYRQGRGGQPNQRFVEEHPQKPRRAGRRTHMTPRGLWIIIPLDEMAQ